MWLRRWTIRLLWNLKVFPQNSQDLLLAWVCGGVVLLGGIGGNGGVLIKGDLGLGWKGFSRRCIGLPRFGDTGGGVELFPASSRSLREKSIAGDSIAIGFKRITLSKALGCWATNPISSALRRCGSRWWRGGGLKSGGVFGSRASAKPGWSRRMGPVIRKRLKGLLSPRKFIRGDGATVSGPRGGGIVIRGVRELLVGLVSR